MASDHECTDNGEYDPQWIVASDPLKATDFEQYFLPVMDDSSVSGRHRIVDMRGIKLEMKTADVSQMARGRGTSAADEGLRIAVLVDSPLAFGLMRMYASLANMDERMCPFWTQSEAVAWLRSGRHPGAVIQLPLTSGAERRRFG